MGFWKALTVAALSAAVPISASAQAVPATCWPREIDHRAALDDAFRMVLTEEWQGPKSTWGPPASREDERGDNGWAECKKLVSDCSPPDDRPTLIYLPDDEAIHAYGLEGHAAAALPPEVNPPAKDEFRHHDMPVIAVTYEIFELTCGINQLGYMLGHEIGHVMCMHGEKESRCQKIMGAKWLENHSKDYRRADGTVDQEQLNKDYESYVNVYVPMVASKYLTEPQADWAGNWAMARVSEKYDTHYTASDGANMFRHAAEWEWAKYPNASDFYHLSPEERAAALERTK